MFGWNGPDRSHKTFVSKINKPPDFVSAKGRLSQGLQDARLRGWAEEVLIWHRQCGGRRGYLPQLIPKQRSCPYRVCKVIVFFRTTARYLTTTITISLSHFSRRPKWVLEWPTSVWSQRAANRICLRNCQCHLRFGHSESDASDGIGYLVFERHCSKLVIAWFESNCKLHLNRLRVAQGRNSSGIGSENLIWVP